jgi:hypothetical protein
MINRRIQKGLFAGTLAAILAIAGKLISGDYHTSADIISIVSRGILFGAACGLASALLLRRKVPPPATPKIYVAAGETLLLQTAAVYFKGIKAIGGQLYLTDRRLVFTANKLTAENALLTIKLADINNFARYKILGLLNHGLQISTKHNSVEKFEVQQPEQWVNQLSERKAIQPTLT